MAKSRQQSSALAQLRKRIESGEFPPGSPLPTEREIACEYIISRAASRKLIASLIRAGLAEQVPKCRPRVLPLAKTAKAIGRIAVWMQLDADDVGSTLILKGVRRVVGAAGRELVVSYPPTGDRSSAKELIAPSATGPGIAGVILWASDDKRLVPFYRDLIAQGLSLVCIDRDTPLPLDADVVATDHFRGARTATEHLLGLGHRRIAMVANDDHVSSVRDRVDGYFSALRDAGVSPDPDLLTEVSFVHAGDLQESAERAIDRLLKLDHPPTAILAVNDQIAMYLQDALLGRGLSVPEDISLVGFDWFLRWLPSGGDLTTVVQPFEKIGEIAARRLLERIEETTPHVSCHILLPAPLLVRSTTRALAPSTVRLPSSPRYPN